MKRMTAFLIITFMGIGSMYSSAQSQEGFIGYYDLEIVQVGYQSFGGLNLSYQGQIYPISFGLASHMKTVLSAYPDTKELVESYSNTNLAGNILTYAGFGITVGSVLVPLISLASHSRSDTYASSNAYRAMATAGFVGIGVGLIAELIGSFILPRSFEQLMQGVSLYNHHKIEEFGK